MPIETALAGKKLVFLVFLGRYCDACNQFRDMTLNPHYPLWNAMGLEVIYVCSDTNEDEFRLNFGGMKCYAAEYKISKKSSATGEDFWRKNWGVRRIPTTWCLNMDGSKYRKTSDECEMLLHSDDMTGEGIVGNGHGYDKVGWEWIPQ